MVSIIEYLPGIPRAYWRDYVRAIEPTKPLVIPAGARKVQLFPSDLIDRRGFILQVAVNSNNSEITINVAIDNRIISVTPSQLYYAGYTGYYIPNVPWVSEYNTTDNIYVANLFGEIPFDHDVNAYIDNTTTSPAVIGSMGFQAIVLNEGFYKALADLINGKD